jgi:hypothetical protein
MPSELTQNALKRIQGITLVSQIAVGKIIDAGLERDERTNIQGISRRHGNLKDVDGRPVPLFAEDMERLERN